MSKTNLQRWQHFCKDLPSPDMFIEWTWYSTVAASLERRVWIGPDGMNPIYPNMFIIFVAEPGGGKSFAANQARDHLLIPLDKMDEAGVEQEVIKRGPDSVTLARLIEYLNEHAKDKQVGVLDNGKPKIYSYAGLYFCAGDELGTLLASDTHDLVTFLNKSWDGGTFKKETKFAGKDTVRNICVSLLGSCTPEWMRANCDSRIMNEGFSARTIFTWGGPSRPAPMYLDYAQSQIDDMLHLRAHIKELTEIYGRIKMTPEVNDWCNNWSYKESKKRINNDRKLAYYYGRKNQHILKLAIAMRFSDTYDSLKLRVEDLERACNLLMRTEINMSDALAAVTKNPIASIAADLERFITDNKRVSWQVILVQCFSLGEEWQLKSALSYLTDSGKIWKSKVSEEWFSNTEKSAVVAEPRSTVSEEPVAHVEVKPGTVQSITSINMEE